MTDIRVGDDDGALWLFSGEEEEGHPLVVVDGDRPTFIAGRSGYHIPFLFGVCADQEARTKLYEHLRSGLLRYTVEALEGEQWAKAASFIDALSEADAYRVLKYKRK